MLLLFLVLKQIRQNCQQIYTSLSKETDAEVIFIETRSRVLRTCPKLFNNWKFTIAYLLAGLENQIMEQFDVSCNFNNLNFYLLKLKRILFGSNVVSINEWYPRQFNKFPSVSSFSCSVQKAHDIDISNARKASLPEKSHIKMSMKGRACLKHEMAKWQCISVLQKEKCMSQMS